MLFGATQSLEDVYRLIWAAVEHRCPIAAMYDSFSRLLCPHRLGKNKYRQLRVLCYQYGGESESGLQPVGSPANWRCMAVDKLIGWNFWTARGVLHRIIPAPP